MLIIVEGPSGSGKTHLIKRLKREIEATYPPNVKRVEVIHKGPPTRHPLDEYETPLFDYRPLTGRDVICDRWHVGELVYPAAYERDTEMDRPAYRHIELFLRSRGAFLVHVTAAPSELERRLVERGRLADDTRPADVEVLPLTRTIQSWFSEMIDHSLLPTMNVWTSEHGERFRPSYANLIVNEAIEEEKRAAAFNDFVTYVGQSRVDLLLFGDVRNGKWATGQGPAFGPYRGTSGHYLFGAIREHAFWNLGVANACDVDDPVALWKTLGRPRVVGLGRRAQTRLARLGIDNVHLPHPQYVRRFHHRRKMEYGTRITNIMREVQGVR